MFSCHNCGADLRFSPEKQKLVCDHCNSEFTAKEYNEKLAFGAEAHDDAGYAVTVFTCPQCGGELLTEDDTAATFCSYCGSSVMLELVIREEMKPDYIIPFEVTKDECRSKYKQMIAKSRYLPRIMKQEDHISQFRGIYMPFWVYEYEVKDYTLHWQYPPRVKYEHMRTETFDLHVKQNGKLMGPSFDASSTFADPLCNAIAPYDYKKQVSFSPAYLSGFYADSNDIDADVYKMTADVEARKYVGEELCRDNMMSGSKVLPEDFEDKKDLLKKDRPKLAFYPVWFLASKSRNGKRVSYAVVNGQTGKIAADLPVDFRQYLLTSLLIAVPFFLLFNLFLTLTPVKAVIASILFALFAIKVAREDSIKMKKHEMHLDDPGKAYAQRMAGPMAKKENSMSEYNYLLPLIGVILGVVVIILNPARDIFFYGASVIITALVILTFFRIVSNLNRMATRPLPQLGKRGGEENV